MIYGIVPAAGSGTRFRLDPHAPAKQFLPFGSGSVLTTTVGALLDADVFDGLIIVVPKETVDALTQYFAKREMPCPVRIIPGGRERQDSVRCAVAELPAGVSYVVVHDGVRPLVTPQLVRRVLTAAQAYGAATVGLPIADTIKRVDDAGWVTETVERAHLWTVQTPQAFRKDVLVKAHDYALQHGIVATDDASLVEALGLPVHVVSGHPRNIKITRPEDLETAKAWMAAKEERDMRVGIGYDVHRLVPDRPLILGGVEIPHELGLAGHSDADVLTHAVMDALLGAAALGDIGQHFPDTDAAYKDASSIKLLERVVALLEEHGYEPVQIDSVVAAQRPRLATYLPQMQSRLADVLKLPPNAVSIKATTAEGLGFVGREEGIEARVVAMVRGCRAN